MLKKSKQDNEARDRQKGVPFYPPGYLHYPADLLRGQFSRRECLAQLEQELAAAWPQAFLQVLLLGHPVASLWPELISGWLSTPSHWVIIAPR